MYRLFASDVDDTLLAHDGSLPEATRRALKILHENGVAVVLSSGRATSSMRPFVEKIIEPADDEYIISFNGGRVVTVLSDTVIHQELLPPASIAAIMDYCREQELHIQGYTADGFVVEDMPGTSRAEADTYSKFSFLPYETVPSMVDALGDGSVKMLIIGEHQALIEHRRALMEMSGERYSVMFSKPNYLEIVAKGVSKGHALEILALRLGIPLSQCIAMGDSLNDIEMIETAGLGVAVGNAREELKERAGLVLKRSADESAIVEMMEHCFPELAAKL